MSDGQTIWDYERKPKTVEATLDAVRSQIVAMTSPDYTPRRDGVTLTAEFAADLCGRLMRLERMVAELTGAFATLKREMDAR